MSFFRNLFSRKRSGDAQRQAEINNIYQVDQDVPVRFSSALGNVTPERMAGTHSFDFKVNSPTLTSNANTMTSLSKQSEDLANESYLATSGDPRRSRYYTAFEQQFNDEYDRLRGQTATRAATSQNNALGRITGAADQRNLASYKATLPYAFAQNTINPLIQGNTSTQNSLNTQMINTQNALMSGWSAGQNAYENNIDRRLAERTYQQNTFNAEKNSRRTFGDYLSGLMTAGGAVAGGMVGGAEGAKVGADVGRTVGATFKPATYATDIQYRGGETKTNMIPDFALTGEGTDYAKLADILAGMLGQKNSPNPGSATPNYGIGGDTTGGTPDYRQGSNSRWNPNTQPSSVNLLHRLAGTS